MTRKYWKKVEAKGSRLAEICVSPHQGCQMVYISYQKSQFGYILQALGMEKLVYFVAIGIFDGHFLYFVVI
jgi:hypothetical protein